VGETAGREEISVGGLSNTAKKGKLGGNMGKAWGTEEEKKLPTGTNPGKGIIFGITRGGAEISLK